MEHTGNITSENVIFSLSSIIVTLGIGDHKADGIGLGCTLHEVWFQPKASFTAAGTANDEHVFIPCSLGIFRSVVHSQPFRFSEDDIVFKGGIDVGLDIL